LFWHPIDKIHSFLNFTRRVAVGDITEIDDTRSRRRARKVLFARLFYVFVIHILEARVVQI
jgi:hypothetical protein